MGERLKKAIHNFGYTRIIIILFLAMLIISAVMLKLQMKNI